MQNEKTFINTKLNKIRNKLKHLLFKITQMKVTGVYLEEYDIFPLMYNITINTQSVNIS